MSDEDLIQHRDVNESYGYSIAKLQMELLRMEQNLKQSMSLTDYDKLMQSQVLASGRMTYDGTTAGSSNSNLL